MFDSIFSWKNTPHGFSWGIYNISTDTLSVQSFVSYSDDYSYHVREDKYKINSNQEILLVSNHCNCYKNYPGNTIYYQPFIKYEFHEYPIKPDSSSIWFKQKRWYKNGVINSVH